MEYRPLGRTGLEVSALCLGTVKFGRKTSEQDSRRIIRRAVDAGINFIDTAHVYASEPIVGRALQRDGLRGRVHICTKITPMANDRASIVEQCELSLRRLRTDVIDVLLLHRPNPGLPVDESLGALDVLVRAGKVRCVGTSGFKSWQILEGLWVAHELGLRRFAVEQCVYSLMARWIELELLPMCRTYGVGTMIWSPLGAGVLTDRYSRDNPPEHVELSEREWRVLEVVQALAEEKGCSPSQLAIAWCLRQPGVTCPIAGPSTVQQLDDNLGAIDIELDEADLQRLDQASPPGWTARQEWLGWKFGCPHEHGFFETMPDVDASGLAD